MDAIDGYDVTMIALAVLVVVLMVTSVIIARRAIKRIGS